MATISIRLSCVLPRWALSSDPHVRINGGPPLRLTKEATVAEVPAGPFEVAVSAWHPGALPSEEAAASRTRRFRAEATAGERVMLRYHPAWIASYMFRGRLRRE
jgi:hypothetical protein